MPTEENLPPGDTFPREYVEKLRKEAARHRTNLRAYEEKFAGYNDNEKAYLLDTIATLNSDPEVGAIALRDISVSMLDSDKFYEGLTDAPVSTEPVATPTLPTALVPQMQPPQEDDQMSFTKEDMLAMFKERDDAAAVANQKAAEEAEIQSVFTEIEALGFEQGSPAFMTTLSLAQAQANLDQPVDFAALAPKVRQFVGMPEPGTEGTTTEGTTATTETTSSSVGAQLAAGAVTPVTPVPEHAITAGLQTSSTPSEKPKDWIAEAKEAGISPMQVARKRMQAKLDAA
jgi:hypothetical protein